MAEFTVDPVVWSGQCEHHLVEDADLGCRLHPEVVEPLRLLREQARDEGFELAVASSFRDFSRQCRIWNDKVAGLRPVLDDEGRPIDLHQLDDWGKLQAILRWSALPGASRHHWGTDLDIFDRAGLTAAHPRLELTIAECETGGPFHAFHCWLDQRLGLEPDTGFYRPYAEDRGGVGREPWHISYAPVASRFERSLTPAALRQVISGSSIALRSAVLDHLDEIYARFICPG
ncbi:M15 family metallopeptidase [Gilvimarinus sp. F26214L]|uniref:M15 family metallopeptidase n=1 Tax=Gilvimarinus sp. DZF01 TaxID=3461371 RepID=UPI004046615A